MSQLQLLAERLAFLNVQLFTIGDKPVTLSSLILLVVGIFMLLLASRWLGHWVAHTALQRTPLDLDRRQAIGSLVRYVVLVIGFVQVVQTIGVDLTALSVLAGAVGVGVGFGLQNVVSNFISGLIILFERPVKIGDRIEIAGVTGDVVHIGARATTLATGEHATVFVPNQKFITDPVRNNDVGTAATSVPIRIKAASGSEPRRVEQLLRDIAHAQRELLADPEPSVNLIALDAGGYTFEMLAWAKTSSPAQRAQLLSRMHFALLERLNAEGIKLA